MMKGFCAERENVRVARGPLEEMGAQEHAFLFSLGAMDNVYASHRRVHGKSGSEEFKWEFERPASGCLLLKGCD
jgi:hypothetical protein